MHRSTRGRGVATRAPTPSLERRFALSFALLFGLSVAAAACDGGRPSPVPTVPLPSLASPASSQRLPTPVPTPVVTPGAPSPAPTVVAATGRLLLRLTTCSHACDATPGTTFLDDGTLLWDEPDGSGQVLEARLTEAAIATVRAAIEATPALAADGTYQPKLKPGAEPIPHGVGLFLFDVQWAAGPVLVTAWDPESIADQPELWIVPPEMPQLAELAAKLQDPVAWLGEASFATAPVPYAPTGALVRIDLFPDVGDVGAPGGEVDDVGWPFGQPIERAGEPIEGEGAPAPRCVVLDEAGLQDLRAAELEAGVARDQRAWETAVEYDWPRTDGFVQVTVRQLLPYEQGSCAELLGDGP